MNGLLGSHIVGLTRSTQSASSVGDSDGSGSTRVFFT